MEQAHTILATWWSERGLSPFAVGANEARVVEIESRYRLSLPNDFRDYLIIGAPREEFWDDEDIIWWPAKKIKNIPDEYEHTINNPAILAKADKYLFFADYMIWCWAWAICCEDGKDRGKVAIISGQYDLWVANSFTEFVQSYVADPAGVTTPGFGA